MSAWARMTAGACSLILAAVWAGCGDAVHHSRASPEQSARRPVSVRVRHDHRPPQPTPRAFVTAETKNRMYIVDLASGRTTRAVALPGDPENVVSQGVAVVVSPRAGAVTLVDPRTLKKLRVIRGLGSPHIPAISPDGRYAYITDDARGTLNVIRLADRSVVDRIAVGAAAHHMSFRPDGRRLWIALGESARTIVVLDTSTLARPSVIGRFDPGYPVHDLTFTPDGQRVWVTSATGPDVGVFDARRDRLIFRVPVGAPPQHVVFSGSSAYVTSGYGSIIEMVALAGGRVIGRAPAPYGSFELDAADGYVTTSSLFRGTLAIYNRQLKPVRQLHVAQAARDVAIVPGWGPQP